MQKEILSFSVLSMDLFMRGAAGDRNAFIIALSMQPQRLVIGDIEAKNVN